MRRHFVFFILQAVFIVAHCSGQSVLDHFVSREGDQLMDGTNEFRFISFNNSFQ